VRRSVVISEKKDHAPGGGGGGGTMAISRVMLKMVIYLGLMSP